MLGSEHVLAKFYYLRFLGTIIILSC